MNSATSAGRATPLLLGFLHHDGDSGLHLGHLDVRGETPLEAVPEAFFEIGNLLGELVGCEYDLLVRLVKAVEGVEELLLSALSTGEKLDVVHDQNVHLSEAILEVVHPVLSEGRDQIVDERLAREVRDPSERVAVEDRVTDRVHQVSLADSDPAVDEERVVLLAGTMGDGPPAACANWLLGPTTKLSKV
jgi:hypothetical protein